MPASGGGRDCLVTEPGDLGAQHPLGGQQAPSISTFLSFDSRGCSECLTGKEGLCPQEGHDPSTLYLAPGKKVLSPEAPVGGSYQHLPVGCRTKMGLFWRRGHVRLSSHFQLALGLNPCQDSEG